MARPGDTDHFALDIFREVDADRESGLWTPTDEQVPVVLSVEEAVEDHLVVLLRNKLPPFLRVQPETVDSEAPDRIQPLVFFTVHL